MSNRRITLDKRTVIPVGVVVSVFFLVVPAITYIVSLSSRVEAQDTRLESQKQVLQRIDDRTRAIQLDVQDLKTRADFE